MRTIHSCGLIAISAFVLLADMALSAEPRVELELATEANFPVTGSHQWIDSLKGLKLAGLRIRAAQTSERPQVKSVGTDSAPAYQVVGIVSARGTLTLPGGTFRRGDTEGIAAWIDRLKKGGNPAQGADAAFGLSPEELVELNKKLAAPVAFSTKQKSAAAIAQQIAAALPMPVASDTAARAKLADDFVLQEEMQGVSSGTALAAALRPLGLVMAPRKTGANVSLAIVDARQAQQSWPVGWPTEKSDGEIAPDLFKSLKVEIVETPLLDALGAIEGRTSVPFLFDHNGLARAGIDLTRAQASLPETRTTYRQILKRLLAKVELSSEVRLDEAGKPFVWIYSQRP